MKISAILATALTLSLFNTAQAEEQPGEYGAVFTLAPAQTGLNPNKLKVFPYVAKEWDNGWYAIVRQGFGKYFIQDDSRKIGIGLWADLGRNIKDDSQLANLKNIKATPAINFNFAYDIGQGRELFGFVETALGEHKGTRAQVAFGRTLSANPQQMLFVKGDFYAQFVDTKYAKAYYSVSAAEATASKFENAYSARGGLDRVGARLNVQKNLSDSLYIKSTWSIGWVTGPASKTPISNRRLNAGIAVVLGSYF